MGAQSAPLALLTGPTYSHYRDGETEAGFPKAIKELKATQQKGQAKCRVPLPAAGDSRGFCH